jgi:type II secretory pathway pseudopilin PulG
VLITLGIIGVVAALTMPVLMANYQKKVLETRIKKFYSTYMQALNQAQTEGFNDSMLISANNPDEMLEFFETNYAPYIKTIEVKKLAKGLAIGLSDGSGMYLKKDSASSQGTGSASILFCVNYKNCKDADETKNVTAMPDGKNTFLFWITKVIPQPSKWDRDYLLTQCSGSAKNLCTTLLYYDGWEVAPDYPF